MANPFLYPDKPLKLDVERVVFDKLLIGANRAVPRSVLKELGEKHMDHTLRQATLYSELSPVIDHLIVALRAWVLQGQHVENTVNTVQVPTTWWDHIKHDMRLSTKRWVVWMAMRFAAPNYTTIQQIEQHTTRVCPHNDHYFSESKKHIEWLLWRETE